MPFSKLDEHLTNSSLWSEPYHVRIVFIAFLSLKDENGLVVGVRSTLQRICNVTIEDYDEAVAILSSPDEESKSKEFEGRRISKCDDGWVVLNHEKYRLPEQIKAEERKKYMKNYMRDKRSKDICKVNNKLTPVNSEFTSVSASSSVSSSVSSSDKKNVDLIYAEYPRKEGCAAAKKAIAKSLNKITFDELLLNVKEYAVSVAQKEKKYIPHPATWFNQERWNDEIVIETSISKPKKNEYKQTNNSIPMMEI